RPDPPPAEVGSRPGARAAEEVHELTTDSFAHYFRTRRRRRARSSHEQDFTREAAPALLTVEQADEPQEAPSDADRDRAPRPPRRPTHRVRGTRTPDNRTRAAELTMPAAPLMALAEGAGVALTMDLTALFLEPIRRADALRDHPGRARLRSGRRLPRGSRPGAPGGVQRRGDPGGARAQAPPADPGGALAARADRAPPGQGPAAEPDQPREQPLAHR